MWTHGEPGCHVEVFPPRFAPPQRVTVHDCTSSLSHAVTQEHYGHNRDLQITLNEQCALTLYTEALRVQLTSHVLQTHGWANTTGK